MFDIHHHLDKIQYEYGSFYRHFKYFDQMMEKWRECFKSASDKRKKPMVARIPTTKGEEIATETYQQELVFEDNRVFVFEWDIVLASFDLLQKKEQQRIDVASVVPFITKEELSFEHPEKKQPYFPIILLHAHGFQTHIVLNGNHRIMEAYQKRKSSIRGYYIEDHSHVQWMTSGIMQAMYEFLLDMRKIDKAITISNGNLPDHDKLYKQLVIANKKIDN